MHKLVILINEPADPDRFEADWPKFLGWAEQMPGLRKEVSCRVTHTLYGHFPHHLVHEFHFETPQAAYQALESPAGQAAGQTLQAITHGQVILFFADHREDTLENIRPELSNTAPPDPENHA